MSAERATILDLLDAFERVSGAQLTIFENEHPEAPAAFTVWCLANGHIAESITYPNFRVLRCWLPPKGDMPPAVTIHLKEPSAALPNNDAEP